MGRERYALYFTPEPGSDLAKFGSSAIGYDGALGKDVSFFPATDSNDLNWADLTADPRRYGFHATLKAPFELADGRTEAELLEALDAFCMTRAPIDDVVLELGAEHGFFALRPVRGAAQVAALAQDCVESFDAFRAPLTASDRERRSPSRLTAAQRANLERWGYPWVGDEFRFHMTLTGGVASDIAATVDGILRGGWPGPSLVTIDAISLCRQASRTERFVTLRRLRLRGNALAA